MKRFVLLLALSSVVLSSCEKIFNGKPKPLSVFDFILENPDRASFYMAINDTLRITINGDKKALPGNNTHLVIAMEYARQISEGIINKQDTMVALGDLEVFDLRERIDPGHFKWLKYLESAKLIRDDKVSLEEAVRGMLKYKSMAIGEYLGHKLGFLNINLMKNAMGLKNSAPLYPYPVSSYLLFSTYPDGTSIKQPSQTTDLTEALYLQQCVAIHEGLKKDLKGTLRKTLLDHPPVINQKLFEKWQLQVPTKDYYTLVNKINTSKGVTPHMKNRFDRVMEWSLQDNRVYYSHIARDLGISSATVSGILYATDIQGYRTEMVCFLSDLTYEEKNALGSMMDGFLMNCTYKNNRDNILRKLKPE